MRQMSHEETFSKWELDSFTKYKRITKLVLKSDDIAMRWKANRVCCCVALHKGNCEGHTTVQFLVKGNSVGA